MTLQFASLTLISTLVVVQPQQAVTEMGQVSGQVIEEGTNAPVADARVIVILENDLSAPAGIPPASISDREGHYRFDALPAGRYRIAAQKAGFAPPMEPETMQRFEVAAGQSLDGVTVSLRRGGVISGRVLDSLGQPRAEVNVTALLKRLRSDDRPAGQTWSGPPLLMPSGQSQTNDLGEFRIFGLWPGDYVIAASPRSNVDGAATSSATTTVTSTFFPAAADVSQAEAVTVQAGETLGDLTIQLVTVPAFQVSGVVVDESGAPVANEMVMLMEGSHETGAAAAFLSLAMGPRGMSQSDADGRFSFGDVAPGSYTLRALGGFGVGAFGVTDSFGIDSDGTPRGAPDRPKPAQEPGTLAVTVENANVSDLKIVVTRSR